MDLRDKKTKITFYQGMRTIGGTIIEVNYGKNSIYFDFGSEFKPEVEEKRISSLKDLISYGLALDLKGIYDRKHTDEVPESYKNKAVFISHIHLDHTKMINYIDESIPVYTSKDTAKLLEVLNSNDEFLYANPKLSTTTRQLNAVNYGDVIHIGEIEVEFVRVDHDGYGACGFIINTPDLSIAYTGDIRLHGYRKEDSLNFINKAKKCDILIIEGVSVSFIDKIEDFEPEVELTEDNIVKEFDKILQANKNRQITFNYYEANIERIIGIIKVSKKNNRTLVLNEFYSYILKEVLGEEVHFYGDNYKKYNLDENLKIEIDILLKDHENYIWQLPKDQLYLLEDMIESGIYIHCDADPLGEFDINYKPFMEEFRKHKINVIELKCSGHAFPKDLIYIIDQIKPDLLVPIHSQKPEMLYNKYGDRLLPEKNQTIYGRKNEKK